MPGRELNFKLYIEGIEVPFINAIVSATANVPSTMRATMVPSPAIWDVRPRSLVHMFFKDDYIGPEPGGKIQSTPVWRLLWEGEVIGIGYGKSPGERHVFLECTDLSNYWDYTKQYFLSSLRHGLVTTDRSLFFGTRKLSLTILENLSPWYQKFFAGEKNLAKAIVKMTQEFTRDLIYWETLNSRLHLNDKIFAIDDEEVIKLTDATKLEQVIKGITGQLGGPTPLRTIINTLKEIIYYVHIPVIAPPFRRTTAPGAEVTGTPRGAQTVATVTSFLFKPNIYMTTPPRCNVMFPDQISSINYSRSFLQEPTRLALAANHVLTDENKSAEGQPKILQQFFYAPTQLAESIKETKITLNQLVGKKLTEEEKEKVRDEIKDIDRFLITEEEYEKGLIPVDQKLPFAKYSSVATSERSKTLLENFQQIAEYQLQLHRFAPRSMTVTTEFNPWLVLSFPCAVFDSNRSYFANIVNISHTIDATGGSSTQISCNLAREIVLEDEEVPTLPQWLNKKYHPDAVGGDFGTYMELLGCEALSTTNQSIARSVLQDPSFSSAIRQQFAAQVQFDLAELANGVYQLQKGTATNPVDPTGEYDLAATNRDAYQYARGYQRRNVATIAEVFGEVYNLGVKDSVEAPSSVPLSSSGTELATAAELEGTPFDYRPRSELAKDVKQRRKKGGKEIGNLDVPGHKREPIVRYVREITELRGLDGS